ncbi:MAG: hypothetical protein HY257_05400 [Chloroflexi bacterium]|nr:hypothetical protein [Chloroflexota bacterium]
MKAIQIPARSKILNNLLKKARRKEIILESAEGQHFVLASLEQWEGFEIQDDDITMNKALMEHLAKRRSGSKRIPIAKVRSELGLAQ